MLNEFPNRLVVMGVLLALCFSQSQLADATTNRFSTRTAAEGFDTLVLCPVTFKTELKRWVDYRARQGYRILVQTPKRSPFLIKKQILEVAAKNELKHVVLVGDSGDEQTADETKIPTHLVRAQDTQLLPLVGLEIASDNVYADFNDDDIPDVSIGRIPIDSPKELKLYIDRVQQYEQDGLPIEALRRINFVAGVGNFSKLIDGVIEETTKQIITDLLPGQMQTSMTYGSWSSPYFPDPRKFSDNALARFNEGCLFWVYIGHGGPLGLDNIYVPGKAYRILDRTNMNQIDAQRGSPIAIFLACYSNATDLKIDGLAESLLKRPGGPIASIGGSRITKPAAMALLSLSMMHEYFHGSLPTLGEIFLKSKQEMMKGGESYPKYREMIEGLSKTFSPKAAFSKEKRDHAHLLQLLGDPLLRLPRAKQIQLGDRIDASAGDTLTISGKVPVGGKLTLELSYRRDRLRERFKRRRAFDPSEESLQSFQTTYDQSRQLICQRVDVEVNRGLFAAKLEIPEDVHGECVIMARLDSSSGPALGSVPVKIAKSKKTTK